MKHAEGSLVWIQHATGCVLKEAGNFSSETSPESAFRHCIYLMGCLSLFKANAVQSSPGLWARQLSVLSYYLHTRSTPVGFPTMQSFPKPKTTSLSFGPCPSATGPPDSMGATCLPECPQAAGVMGNCPLGEALAQVLCCQEVREA